MNTGDVVALRSGECLRGDGDFGESVGAVEEVGWNTLRCSFHGNSGRSVYVSNNVNFY